MAHHLPGEPAPNNTAPGAGYYMITDADGKTTVWASGPGGNVQNFKVDVPSTSTTFDVVLPVAAANTLYVVNVTLEQASGATPVVSHFIHDLTTTQFTVAFSAALPVDGVLHVNVVEH